MEAENYLASGFGIRVALESKSAGWVPFREMAQVRQPGRLKGIVVSPKCGTPYLGATQVFDNRPVPRRWLALERTDLATDLFVRRGMFVVTRSGAVGRTLVVNSPLEGMIISDDLLRVEPKQSMWWGWIYAFLRAPQARQMMTGARYGHMIKHLESSHLNELPTPVVNDRWRKRFNTAVARIVELRDRAHKLAVEAETLFEQAVGQLEVQDLGEEGFFIGSAEISRGRRRFDAWPNNPQIRTIDAHLAKGDRRTMRLEDAGFDIWLPTRFKRIAATEGVDLIGSSDLFEINPDITKRIADGDFGDRHRGRVHTGWILLSRSGQIYGLNGSAVLATEAHENKIISDHIIRIAPNGKLNARIGYVYVAISHPTLGRPRVKGLAYGSSIPEIEVADVKDLVLIRLGESIEDSIANAAEDSSRIQAEAELLERNLASEADTIITRFLTGDFEDFEMN